MNVLRTIRSGVIRRFAIFGVSAFCCVILPIGCSESDSRESTMPPADFVKKLETERPEIFVKKVGKGNKTEVLGGREKRAVIRKEWEKTKQGTE